MDRLYLYVPPEEYERVKAAGAEWDDASKSWYIEADADPTIFMQWLPHEDDEEDLQIVSDEAYVASAQAPCLNCHRTIEVICIYCAAGTVSGEPLSQFTLSHISAMDRGLAMQLAPWPLFKKAGQGSGDRSFANHCAHCGATQDEVQLHAEPEGPFFDIPHAAPGSLRLTPLTGVIAVNGDHSFTV